MSATQINRPCSRETLAVKDNTGRAKTVIIVYYYWIGVTVVSLLAGCYQLYVLEKKREGENVHEDITQLSEWAQKIIGFYKFGFSVALLVVFLNWFRRAYGNLHRLDAGQLRHKEKMAVWSWFIPVINLYRPAQIMLEIWTGTQVKIQKMDPSFVLKKGAPLILSWWLLTLLPLLARPVRLTAADHITAVMIADALEIPLALLVMLIIRKVSAMEAILAETVKKKGAAVV